MKLSERLNIARTDRPDEWIMDEFTRLAQILEKENTDKSHQPSRPIDESTKPVKSESQEITFKFVETELRACEKCCLTENCEADSLYYIQQILPCFSSEREDGKSGYWVIKEPVEIES
jgi:hypothetical protein